jgi:hypothetical protein
MRDNKGDSPFGLVEESLCRAPITAFHVYQGPLCVLLLTATSHTTAQQDYSGSGYSGTLTQTNVGATTPVWDSKGLRLGTKSDHIVISSSFCSAMATKTNWTITLTVQYNTVR